jgi:hypothetical protein
MKQKAALARFFVRARQGSTIANCLQKQHQGNQQKCPEQTGNLDDVKPAAGPGA